MEKRIIVRKAIERKPNCLYYIDKEGNICETEMIHKGRPKKENAKTKN